MNINKVEANLIREWFDCAHDRDIGYLQKRDYILAKKIYDECGVRFANSMLKKIENKKEKIEAKSCPFCGWTPTKFGRTLDENNDVVPQVIHLENHNCPLSILVFRLKEWNIRNEHK